MNKEIFTQYSFNDPFTYRDALYHHANLYMDAFACYLELYRTQKTYEARLEYSDITSWAKYLSLDDSHPGRPLPHKLHQSLTLSVMGMWACFLEKKRAVASLIHVLLQSAELQQSILDCTIEIDVDAYSGFLFIFFHEMEHMTMLYPSRDYGTPSTAAEPTADMLAKKSRENFDAFLDTLRNAAVNTNALFLPALVRHYRQCEQEYNPIPWANEADAYRQFGIPYQQQKDDFDARYVPDIPVDEKDTSMFTVCLNCRHIIHIAGELRGAMDGNCPDCGAPLRYNPED